MFIKHKILLSFLILLVVLASAFSASFALFSSRVTIRGFSISTGLWGAPSAPQLKSPEDNLLTNINQFFEWFESTQVNFPPATYTFEIYNTYPFVEPPIFPYIFEDGISGTRSPEANTLALSDGNYYWRVKAVDARGTPSSWSNFRKLTIDKTPPQTLISVENSPRVLINEQIPFGNFEKYTNTNNLTEDYLLNGDISLWQNDDSYLSQSHEGNKMLRVGALPSQAEGRNYLNNSISFSFPNESKTLSFYYNYYSRDEYPFDDPGFLLKINDEDVFKLNSLEVTSGENTGWKQFYYDISKIEGNIQLDFFAGNNFDNFRQSWIYIDQISTGRVAVNSKAKFILETIDKAPSNTMFYCIDNCPDETKYIPYIEPFSLNLSQGEHNIFFFSKDNLGNIENPQVKFIFFDNTPPQRITDLFLKNLSSDSAVLVFSAPAQDDATSSGKVSGYEGRISDEYIDDASASSLLENWWGRATQFSTRVVPQEPGSLEEFNILSLIVDKNYFVAVKSFDAPLNYSEVSNIVNFYILPTPTPTSTPTPTITPTATLTPTLTPTPMPINLIQNGGFEDGLIWWKGYGLKPSISSEIFYSGRQSTYLNTNNTGYYNYISQEIIGGLGNKKYKISGMIKKKTDDLEKAEIRILLYDSEGTQVGSTIESNEIDGDWEEAKINILTPIPTQVEKMVVKLTLKKKKVGDLTPTPISASAYFDDIVVEEIN